MHVEPGPRAAASKRMLFRWIPALLALALAAWLLWPPAEDESPALAVKDGVGAADHADVRTLTGAPANEPGLRGRTPTESDDDPARAAFEEGFDRARGRFRAMPFAVRFVEAETGRSVQIPWHPFDNRDIPLSADEEIHTDAEGAEAAKDESETKGRPFARTSPQMLMPNRGCDGVYGVVLDGEALRRRVAWDDERWDVPISKYATSLEAVYPLRAEARVFVRCVEHDGTRVEGIVVAGFKVAGRNSHGAVRVLAEGEGLLVRRVPFFRSQRLEVLVRRAPLDPSDLRLVEVEEDASEEVEAECLGGSFFAESIQGAAVGTGRLPRAPERLVRIVARFAEDPSSYVVWGSDLIFSETMGTWAFNVPQVEKGTLRVVVVRQDSGPVMGASVRCFQQVASTDESGVAVLEDVPVGERTVWLDEPGLVMTTQKVQVVAGGVTRVTLREAQGGSLRVRVLAPDGEPAPFAIVLLPAQTGWVDLKDGVQRLDPFTDVHGRRTLAHVPAGELEVEASWGGLAGSVKVTVAEGGVATVTIKLLALKTEDPKTEDPKTAETK